jgi:hypothetical protein
LAYLDDVVHTLNAARATGGIDCGLYWVGEREIGVRTGWSPSGCAVGTVLDPLAILESVERLLDEGVDAIGGVGDSWCNDRAPSRRWQPNYALYSMNCPRRSSVRRTVACGTSPKWRLRRI